MTDPREAKLPAWAQDALRYARNERDRATMELRAFRAALPTRVVFDPNASLVGTDRTHQYLADDAYIRFAMDVPDAMKSRERMDVKLADNGYGPHLEVMGSGPFFIEPHSSNLVRIKLCGN